MSHPAATAAPISRVTATDGVPPLQTTGTGTRRTAAATRTLTPSTTQIVPLIVGSNHAALSLSRRLRDAGYFITAIRPSTVPAGTARLRFAFTAAHTAGDIDGLLNALDDRALPHSATA